jgi:hypothetical protein
LTRSAKKTWGIGKQRPHITGVMGVAKAGTLFVRLKGRWEEKEVSGMAESQRATGTPNTIYDLSSVLFHALEGGASYDRYIQDAEREGDEELTEFFRRVREEDRDRAAEAQMLIAERTPAAARTEGATASASPRPKPSVDFPGTEPLREDVSRARTGEVPPPEEVPPERAGEIPTAEEVPPPRAEEVPSGTPPQAPPGDVQRGTSPTEQERTGQAEGKPEEEKGLIDKAREALLGEEEQRKEGTDRPGRR